MNENKEFYLKLASAIVKKQAQIIGLDLSVKKVRKVPDIIVDDNGKVIKLGKDEIQSLNNLVQEYVNLSGEAAILFSKEAIKPLLIDSKSVMLPNLLQS